MITVYVSIGNSDDKLTQKEWADFQAAFRATMLGAASATYGVWFSAPDAPFQNACMAIGVRTPKVEPLREALTRLRARYNQDSAAWAEVPTTEFI